MDEYPSDACLLILISCDQKIIQRVKREEKFNCLESSSRFSSNVWSLIVYQALMGLRFADQFLLLSLVVVISLYLECKETC